MKIRFLFLSVLLLASFINASGQSEQSVSDVFEKHKNNIEISVFSNYTLTDDFRNLRYEEQGYVVKYKRDLLHGEINTFSIGVDYRLINVFLHQTEIDPNSLFFISNKLYSEQKLQSVGILLSDRMTFNYKKIGFFFNPELLMNLNFSLSQNNYESTQSGEGPLGETHPINTRFEVNPMAFILSFHLGFDINTFKKFTPYIKYGRSANLNQQYKNQIVDARFSPIGKFTLAGPQLSIGFRF